MLGATAQNLLVRRPGSQKFVNPCSNLLALATDIKFVFCTSCICFRIRSATFWINIPHWPFHLHPEERGKIILRYWLLHNTVKTRLYLIFTAELASNFMNLEGLKLRTMGLIETWTDDPRRGVFSYWQYNPLRVYIYNKFIISHTHHIQYNTN